MTGTGERYETRINRAIALIDARLDEDLPLERLAAEACLSPWHFHRLFKTLTGETVHELTTRLRLERALRLANGRQRPQWKEIASRVGYKSHAVFTRAFRRAYGRAPSSFDQSAYWASRPDREAAHAISAYFLRPAPQLPGDFMVDLVERPAARLAVSRAIGSYVNPQAVIRAYRRMIDWAAAEGLSIEDGCLSGASQDDPDITPFEHCRYDFQLEVPEGVRLPEGLFEVRRPPGLWVTTEVSGGMPEVDRAWNLLFKSWLPASGLDLRDAPVEEIYRRSPETIGWERFELLACIPVQPAGRS